MSETDLFQRARFPHTDSEVTNESKLNVGAFLMSGIMGMKLVEEKKDYIEQLYLRMAFSSADERKFVMGQPQTVGVLTPDQVDEGFKNYLQESFGLELVNFTFKDIMKYGNFKEKIEYLKENGINSVNFQSYSNDLPPQMRTILKNRVEMAEKLGFTIKVENLSPEVYENIENYLPADIANNKLEFLRFCENNNLPTLPGRKIVDIKYVENEQGEIDKSSEIGNIDEIKSEIQMILNGGKVAVIQTPKSGGGMGTYFIEDNSGLERFCNNLKYISQNDTLKRPRMEGLLIAPKAKVTEGPSVSFNVSKDDSGNAVITGFDITSQILNSETNACEGIVFPALDIDNETKVLMYKYAQQWAQDLVKNNFTGHTNIDFAFVEKKRINIAESGRPIVETFKELVLVESNSRRTASVNVREITHALNENSDIEIHSQVYDHYEVKLGTTTAEVVEILKNEGVQFLTTVGENTSNTGVILQTSVNSLSGQFSVMIFANSRDEVEAIDNKIREVLQKTLVST